MVVSSVIENIWWDLWLGRYSRSGLVCDDEDYEMKGMGDDGWGMWPRDKGRYGVRVVVMKRWWVQWDEVDWMIQFCEMSWVWIPMGCGDGVMVMKMNESELWSVGSECNGIGFCSFILARAEWNDGVWLVWWAVKSYLVGWISGVLFGWFLHAVRGC